MGRLSQQEVDKYVGLCADLAIGQTRRFNHEGCARTASSKSLGVTRDERGYVLHCHKCSGAGARNGVVSNRKRSHSQDTKPLSKGVSGPQRRTSNVEEWPVHVRMWLQGSTVTTGDLRARRFVYNTTRDRLEMPVLRESRRVYLVQRCFAEDEPKYLSFGKPEHGWVLLRKDGGQEPQARLVLVEDYLSCIVCSRVYDALALFTTTLKDAALKAILDGGYTEVLVVLDDDNPQVRSKQRKLKRQIENIGLGARVIKTGGKDPKELSTEQIEELLK